MLNSRMYNFIISVCFSKLAVLCHVLGKEYWILLDQMKRRNVRCYMYVYICAVGLLLQNFRNNFYVNRAARRRNYLTKQHSHQPDIHSPGLSRTFNPSKRMAAYTHRRPLDQRDGHITFILSTLYFSKISPHIILSFTPCILISSCLLIYQQMHIEVA